MEVNPIFRDVESANSRPPPNQADAWADMPGYELASGLHREDYTAETRQPMKKRQVWWLQMQGWILALAIGACSSLSGGFIDVLVNALSSTRFGWCSDTPFAKESSCNIDSWQAWGTGSKGFLINVGLGTLMATASATLVFCFAKAAAGSGIPEVKTILGGFVMPDVVSLRTLVVKIPGLALSVAAGMSLGKEGPLVHVAVCWAQLLSGTFEQFSDESRRRELISAAAAAGVSTAFGAPLGGILFSLEEVSSIFPMKTLLRSFAAAVTAALVLSLIRGSREGLTLFSVHYDQSAHPFEHIIFALLGVFGGLIGTLFNFLNVRLTAFRMTPGYKRYSNGIIEVTVIALVTLLSSWPLLSTRLLSSDVIHALFEPCGSDQRAPTALNRQLGLCSADGYAPISAELVRTLLFAGAIRLFQTTLTFGTACPAGLFVPSIFVGAALGRCAGLGMAELNDKLHIMPGVEVLPGVYAMVGASAVLGGVCRVTISLVAIMLELTGSMTYIVPFMVATLIAKIVGDTMNEGIYDLYIVLKGYPFLHEEVEVSFDERCCDIMESRLICLDLVLEPRVSDLREMMEAYEYRGFPVVNNGRFIGYAKRTSLMAFIQHVQDGIVRLGLATFSSSQDEQASVPITLDVLLPYVDTTVMRMVPDTSLAQAHKVFKQLGVQNIFVVGSRPHDSTQDVLQGLLSKKKFLLALKSGAVGHRPNTSTSNDFRAPRAARTIVSWLQRGQQTQEQHEDATDLLGSHPTRDVERQPLAHS